MGKKSRDISKNIARKQFLAWEKMRGGQKVVRSYTFLCTKK